MLTYFKAPLLTFHLSFLVNFVKYCFVNLKFCYVIFSSCVARYRVDIGGQPYAAITHYLHAISMDPTNGINIVHIICIYIHQDTQYT